MEIWSQPKWAHAIASQRRCMQGLAKQNRQKTQVFNLGLLASLFGQDFTCVVPCSYSHFQILVCLCLVGKPQRQQHYTALPEIKRGSEIEFSTLTHTQQFKFESQSEEPRLVTQGLVEFYFQQKQQHLFIPQKNLKEFI